MTTMKELRAELSALEYVRDCMPPHVAKPNLPERIVKLKKKIEARRNGRKKVKK